MYKEVSSESVVKEIRRKTRKKSSLNTMSMVLTPFPRLILSDFSTIFVNSKFQMSGEWKFLN